MSKSEENFHKAPASAREIGNLLGTCDDDKAIREILSTVLSASSKSRDQVADEMSLLTGRHITKKMLDSFTAESMENHRWPSAWTRAFCVATNDWTLLRSIVERAGFVMLSREGSEIYELGKCALEAEVANRKFESLRSLIAKTEAKS